MRNQSTAKSKPLWREWLESIAGAVILAALVITFICQSYVVQGSSMEPTLNENDRLLVDKLSYRFTNPSRGDIIVLRTPDTPYIKRIIALGGETIETHNGIVYVNGNPLKEPYLKSNTPGDWGPLLVPKGHYFVMGDNRWESEDSRGSLGFLPREDIIGRALVRYWPLSRVDWLTD